MTHSHPHPHVFPLHENDELNDALGDLGLSSDHKAIFIHQLILLSSLHYLACHEQMEVGSIEVEALCDEIEAKFNELTEPFDAINQCVFMHDQRGPTVGLELASGQTTIFWDGCFNIEFNQEVVDNLNGLSLPMVSKAIMDRMVTLSPDDNDSNLYLSM